VENVSVVRVESPTSELVEPASRSTLMRRAARLWGAARVLARHMDDPAGPAKTQLAAEMDQAADALASALGGAETPANDLDEMLLLRCACL